MIDLVDQLQTAMNAAEDRAEQRANLGLWDSEIARMLIEQVAAGRKILELHEPTVKTDMYDRLFSLTGKSRAQYRCPTCGGRDWDIESLGFQPCGTLVALLEAYGVEVPW